MIKDAEGIAHTVTSFTYSNNLVTIQSNYLEICCLSIRVV